jgi:hypothetical protein
MIRRTRGFLLLPVALTLVAVGALAYAMTRDAGMSVNRVDAAYDTEVARYLAESAVNLARWNNNKTNCSNQPASFTPTQLYRYSVAKGAVGSTAADLVGTMTLNAISVVSNNSNGDKNSITVDVSSATTATPAGSRRIVRTVYRYNLNNRRTATISGNGAGATTTISTTNATPQGTMAYMELSDSGPGDQSYGLLRFNLATLPRNALVRDATLRLKRFDGEVFPLFSRSLDLQRITTSWDPATAVWSLPWTKPGGDVAAVAIDSASIGGNTYYYFTHLDALVAGWMDGTLPNNGVLLKPTNLSKSRFGAFASGDTDGPQLTVNYYERCN